MISAGHRRRLNRALHELRRPLQALTLLDDGPPPAAANGEPNAARRGLLELASSALAEVDRTVNGGGAERQMKEVRCRELVLASVERWRAVAPPGSLRVFWDAGPAPVEADPMAVSQALDNLLANALEHGGSPVVVTGAEVAGRLRITVANGLAGTPRGGEDAGEVNRAGDPRRGHGISVVSSVAAEHRGRFAICRTGAGCVAALELPLAQPRAIAGAA